MINFGDIVAGRTVRIPFDTSDPTGAPITLAGTPVAQAYKDGSLTQTVTGVSLSVDHDGVTGLHLAIVDTSADGTFFAAASDFFVVLSAGTVNGVSVVGKVLGMFSIANRATTAIKSKTDNLPSDPADASDITTAFGLVPGAVRTNLEGGDPIPVNVKQVNDVDLVGDGDGTPWGPA